MFPYGRQTIDQDDIDAVVETLRGDFLTTGPKITEFEKVLCEKTGAPYAVACGNGTLALHLAAIAAGISGGDSVIVPSLTFLATANAVRYCGADVIFADVDPETGLMRAHDLESAIKNAKGKKIKAVMPVHLTGQCVNLREIKKVADQHDIKVIADGAHVLGAEIYGEKIGACKDAMMTTYSFHPVKTIAMGEGGAVTTHDEKLADKMRNLRSHGMEKRPDIGPWAYDMNELGYNYRVTDFQCALGISQMKKLDDFVARRRELADLYDGLLADLAPVILPPMRRDYCASAWHLYAPRFDFDAMALSRGELMSALADKGVGTQVHYIPVHTQPYYKNLYGEIDLPGAQTYYEHTLSLPLYPALSDEDVEYIVQTLKEVVA